MYAPGTILTLNEQRDPDPETDEVFPYNEVEVVNESPIGHAHKGEWSGEDARGVVLRPLSNFGGTLDEPFGKVRQTFTVKSVPEPIVAPGPVHIPVVNGHTSAAGETPEEVFAAKAPGTPPEEGQKRGRTSPIPDVPNPATQSPLDA